MSLNVDKNIPNVVPGTASNRGSETKKVEANVVPGSENSGGTPKARNVVPGTASNRGGETKKVEANVVPGTADNRKSVGKAPNSIMDEARKHNEL